MDARTAWLNRLVNRNHDLFPLENSRAKWISWSRALELQERRDKLLDQMEGGLEWSFHRTKPWINRLSPGCRLCGEGSWSCLFITGRCNANCFYCPSPQESDDPPGTQGMTFDTPESYAEYLDYFSYRGVSISGGEPFLEPEKSIEHLNAAREAGGTDNYRWLYTNGILADRKIFSRLARAGLHEVRFDIGAVNYSLRGIAEARDEVENLTVEVPAVPEDKARLTALLPELVTLGVRYLNLHQLRLTAHNAPRLLARDYSLLHGEQPAVAESEITALEIMLHVLEKGLDLGVNYCAFQYKRRFQQAGYRKTVAEKIRQDGERITENGYLCREAPLSLEQWADSHEKKGPLHLRYRYGWIENLRGTGDIYKTFIFGNREYRVTDRTFLETEVTPLSEEETRRLIQGKGTFIPVDDDLFYLWQAEYIEQGWRDYF